MGMDRSDWVCRVSLIAEEAGTLLRSGLDAEHDVRHKGEVDLVTEMDKASEALIVKRLNAEFPGTGILAEETGVSGPSGGPRWIVDPLDGTTNYAHSLPIFCVSIALECDGRIELGVVHDPMRGETFSAALGFGATLNGRRLAVTKRASLNDALLVTGFPYDIRSSPRNNVAAFASLSVVSRAVRRLGAAALDLAYVAAGRFDGYWEEKLSPWDIAAGILLVAEAGGKVSDYQGRAPDIYAGKIVATNGPIHPQLLAALEVVEEGLAPG